MYNGFGAPTEAYFKTLLEKNPSVPASRFVVDFLSAKSAGDGNTCRALGDIKTALSHLVSSHPDAGGAFGWNFHACELTPYGERNPVEWLHGVHDSMTNPKH